MRLIEPVLPLIALAVLVVLLEPRIRDNRFWRATVTPLASIIGSGFLIVAPLLGASVGRLAPLAMVLIVALAYLIGAVVRFNILNAEPLFRSGSATRAQRLTEHVAKLGLFLAYVVSVAFYLRLMSAFVLKGLGMFTDANAATLTTVVLLSIGIVGWRRGLGGLERLEEYSVSVKLAIIAALLVGLGTYDFEAGFRDVLGDGEARPAGEVLRQLAGMLLVVQGFETSRYLGAEYPAETRARSMRAAQWLSGLIYIGFAVLILPLGDHLPPGRPDETAIIDLSGHVAHVLPLMLVVAAVMSQFSAAIADTLGGGGLVGEETEGRLAERHGYVAIIGLAIVLVWSANIFEIVAYASRAFAFYYLAETVLAFLIAMDRPGGVGRRLRLAGLAAMAALLAWITVYAIPVG